MQNMNPAIVVAVTDAEPQLAELVRRAEAGEEVILTRHGHAAVRLVPVVDRESRSALIREIQDSAVRNAVPGPCAARSADFLHDENGLPG